MKFLNEEKYRKEYGIYQIRNVITGYVYIGQTGDNFLRRYWHHRWKLDAGSHDNSYLQNAFNKYGSDAFVFEVIEVVDDRGILDEREIYHIQRATKKYNLLDGGGGRRGIQMSDHAKALVGEANRKHMVGKHHSEDTKRKMSTSRKGKPYVVYRATTVLDDNTARKIKELLVSGLKPSVVAKRMNIDYSLVNNILSNNAWKHIEVDGWEEYCKNRKKSYRLTREDAERIRSMYAEGYTIQELCDSFQKERHTIYNILSFRTFQ